MKNKIGHDSTEMRNRFEELKSKEYSGGLSKKGRKELHKLRNTIQSKDE